MKSFILVIISLFFFTVSSYGGEIAVIVNDAGPLTEISQADVREIYLGNMKFAKGIPIMPLHYQEGHLKDGFLSSIIGMSSREYRLYWTKKVFQEGGSVPLSQNSFPIIMNFIRDNKGAIGYLPVSELGESRGVKIITTLNVK